jgi:NAD(P)-dependent dehydrogenase (short-subunit alcohol dehydrogenase family)
LGLSGASSVDVEVVRLRESCQTLGTRLAHCLPSTAEWTAKTLSKDKQISRRTEMATPVVLITGALTGIGRATAIIFAQEGANIVVSGRRDQQGEELVAELQGFGAEAIFVRSDVRKDEDVRNLVDQTVKRFGRLDIAVNNAGTEGTPGLVTDQTPESYAATFDTNVMGTLLSMKHELRAMLAQGSGSIVNVSSAYGSVGAAGASVYVASKHAVEGLTKSAALEAAGTGVRVNVVAPGTTDTGMLTRFTSTDQNKAALVSTVPVKRLAAPEEIAHVIVFVASENASYMTGASIPVDGGMLAD